MQNHSTDDLPDPGMLNALSYGWRKMTANFLVFFLAVLVLVVLDIPFGGDLKDHSAWYNLMAFGYWLLFLPVFTYGADLIFLRGVRGDDVDIKDIINGFYNYLNVVLTALLVFGLIGIALVFFIVPGIYVACRLVFASYLVMDEGLDPVAAVEGSWRITTGHAWKIFLLGICSVLICIVGFCLLLVGLLPAIMWAKAAFAAMYLSITDQTADEFAGEEAVMTND